MSRGLQPSRNAHAAARGAILSGTGGRTIVACLRIQLTGDFQIEGAGRPIGASQLGGERARLVFALLVVCRGRALTRDELAEAVWGERLPPTWRSALRNVLTRVRAFAQIMGLGIAVVSAGPGCYRLRCAEADLEVDIEVMERSLEQARAALQADQTAEAQALALAAAEIARRPFLPGLEGSWVDEVRARQHYVLSAALELAGEAALCRDPARTVALARQLIEVDAVSEPAYRLLMRAHVAAGNRAEALTSYMACRAALVEELGIEPSAETQQTYLSILLSTEGEEDLRRSQTRFVDIGGARVAYQTAGAADVDILFVAGSFIHVDTIWHDAGPAAFFSRFLPATRLVFFDPAGTGASDPAPDEDVADLTRRRLEELRCVLDAAQAKRAAVVASLDGGPAALRFAASRPERVSALVLVNTTARWVRAKDYGEGLAPDVADATVARMAASWGTEEFAAHVYPALRADARFLAWYARLQRAMTSPRAAALALRRLQAIDARPALALITAPTLVLHRREHPAFPLAQGRFLAENIRGAKLRVLEGGEGLFGEDSAAIADLIREFVLTNSRIGAARR